MSTETQFDGYRCDICGEFHAGSYSSLAFDSPDPYVSLKEAYKATAHLGTDDCVIGDERYLRGIIELPISGLEGEVFLWGVWARIWQKDYEEFVEHYREKGREKIIGPYKGRLCNKIPGYDPETMNLKCAINVQPVGVRPLFIIDEQEHLLAIEQRNGISIRRAQTLSSLARHLR